ncbi:MAG TPA: ABC transporter permease subunit [Streptosporangiaceae bacterium]
MSAPEASGGHGVTAPAAGRPGATTTPSAAAGTIPARSPAASAPPAARRRPVPWTRLAWVTWRQQRATLAGIAALLGLLGLYLLIMGLKIHSAYASVIACHPASSAACQQLANSFNHDYWGGGGGSAIQAGGAQTVSSLLLIFPVLIGVFAGSPLIARELETGTFRFAWTQGCGRLRWAIAKLVLLAAVLTAAAWAFSELFTWYSQPFIADGQVSRLLPLEFGLLGVAFAAWTLAAFSIGAFAGAVIRRTVPAMAAALVTSTVLALATAISLRQHYEAPLTINAAKPSPAGAWGLGGFYTGPNGQPVSQSTINNVIQHMPASVQNSPDPNSVNTWLSLHHYTQWMSYQPAARFWHFQLIEGGWLLALSLILMAATVWLVRRRAA